MKRINAAVIFAVSLVSCNPRKPEPVADPRISEIRILKEEAKLARLKIAFLESQLAVQKALPVKPIEEARGSISSVANELPLVRKLAAFSRLVPDRNQDFEGLPLDYGVAMDVDFLDSKWEYAMKKYHEALGDPETSARDRKWASEVVTKVEATRREVAAMGYPPGPLKPLK